MNRLAEEPSPYLRQHAENPVDWFPWGEEAFDLARERDVPVILSVGYSSCHWCHVMAHESFEDPDTASEMNASFVSVKVDREERPDVDSVYMDAVQAMTGRGGWPMTVFLTPDARPFYAGTYFPKRDAHGMPSFRRVLAAIADAWESRRSELEKQADELSESVRQSAAMVDRLVAASISATGDEAARIEATAAAEIASRFDAANGGIGAAPKFPQTSLLELSLRHHRHSGEESSLEVVSRTLDAMAAGGIYDHLGGGFARYSTDDTWTVPHFEKMLYDQAGLVLAYTHSYQLTRNLEHLQVVEETVGYVLRDLAVEGVPGLAAAEDADSEGVEGLFYTWTPGEIETALGPDLAVAAVDWYGVTKRGNFDGRSILRRPLGATLTRTDEVERARAGLFEARSARIRPGRDDKVLTEWNAMFASALAQTAAATGRADWSQTAVAIGEFLLTDLRRADGRFLRSWQQGVARYPAYAADYAWCIDCFTRLAELTGRALWLDHAETTAKAMLELFSDPRTGALYSTGSDAEKILVRPVDLLDDATPSASSVAATSLLRLGTLTGDRQLIAAAERLLALLLPLARDHPLAVANAVSGFGLAGGGMLEVVITGGRRDLLDSFRVRYEPDSVLAWGEPTTSPLWEGRSTDRAGADEGAAYVCHRNVCLMPARSPEDLVSQLESESRRPSG
jgi:uncharacterized protein